LDRYFFEIIFEVDHFPARLRAFSMHRRVFGRHPGELPIERMPIGLAFEAVDLERVRVRMHRVAFEGGSETKASQASLSCRLERFARRR
jgi:hypothetical protein